MGGDGLGQSAAAIGGGSRGRGWQGVTLSSELSAALPLAAAPSHPALALALARADGAALQRGGQRRGPGGRGGRAGAGHGGPGLRGGLREPAHQRLPLHPHGGWGGGRDHGAHGHVPRGLGEGEGAGGCMPGAAGAGAPAPALFGDGDAAAAIMQPRCFLSRVMERGLASDALLPAGSMYGTGLPGLPAPSACLAAKGWDCLLPLSPPCSVVVGQNKNAREVPPVSNP